MTRKIGSLKPRIIELQLPAPFDDDVYPVYSMTWGEWESVGSDVPDADTDSVPKLRKPVNGQIQLVEDHKMIAKLKQQVETRRLTRRVAYALQKTGEYDDMKDLSLDDAEQVVQSLDASALNAIAMWLVSHVRNGRARVEYRAERFRDGHKSSSDDTSTTASKPDAQ